MPQPFAAALSALACVAALSGVTACSGSVSVGSSATVSASDLEQKVSDVLEEQVGRAPDAVTCPDDLDAEVDATTRCTITDGDTYIGVSVTVSSVDGTDVGLDVLADDGPTSAPE